MANRHLPALLVIMDGFGLAPEGSDTAVSAANTPFIDSLYATLSLIHISSFRTARWGSAGAFPPILAGIARSPRARLPACSSLRQDVYKRQV